MLHVIMASKQINKRAFMIKKYYTVVGISKHKQETGTEFISVALPQLPYFLKIRKNELDRAYWEQREANLSFQNVFLTKKI